MIIKQTLIDALKAANIDVLPKAIDIEGDWDRAIALLNRSVPGVKSYAIVEKQAGEIKVTDDYGSRYQCSCFTTIDCVYPIYQERDSDNTEQNKDEKKTIKKTVGRPAKKK